MELQSGRGMPGELKELVEAAGIDYVGVNFGTATPPGARRPAASLETLAPHILAASLRDNLVREPANGATVQWAVMGRGCLGLPARRSRAQHQA